MVVTDVFTISENVQYKLDISKCDDGKYYFTIIVLGSPTYIPITDLYALQRAVESAIQSQT